MAEEKMAFKVCESDHQAGLTWQEVKNCKEKFADHLDELYMKVPVESDFASSDLNGDGVLLFGEWKIWAKGLL